MKSPTSKQKKSKKAVLSSTSKKTLAATKPINYRTYVILSILILLTGILGYFYYFAGTVQGDYSNILGVSTDKCRTKVDVNCDTKLDSQDIHVITQHLKKTPGTPTPTPSPKLPNVTASPESTPQPSPTAPTPTPPPGNGPYPGAPPCPTSAHSNNEFHTLWNADLRCHYDHEHGQNPFTAEVAQAFPNLNLRELLGNVGVGHTNPSSSMENTHKHGGFKWQFMPQHPAGCAGFEGSTNGVNGSVIQVHGFGDYNMELTGRIHSSAALLKLCNQANPSDVGYIYTVQFQDYGQIVSPYQGDIIQFPFRPEPAYDPARGPYLTIDCVGQKAPGERGTCRESRDQVLSRNLDAFSNWSSKPTGNSGLVGSTVFQVFFRLRDTYQLIDWSDKTHPFTYSWLCSSDNGTTFNPNGCKYNNSTIQVHEVAGKIPTEWDNLSGFDSDSRTGRITATGFTDRYGTLMRDCTAPRVGASGNRSEDCFPIKMVNAFTGTYGSVLVYTPGKGTNLVPYLPEKDIYFCNGVPCSETDAGAVPSGWVGDHN